MRSFQPVFVFFSQPLPCFQTCTRFIGFSSPLKYCPISKDSIRAVEILSIFFDIVPLLGINGYQNSYFQKRIPDLLLPAFLRSTAIRSKSTLSNLFDLKNWFSTEKKGDRIILFLPRTIENVAKCSDLQVRSRINEYIYQGITMKTDKILLDHGSGGKMSHQLVSDLMLPLFNNPMLEALHDGAILDVQGQRLAFSTDSYVVDPIFFPGGSIGDLAVNGTVNDVAMCGAVPLYVSVGLIIEEGFSMGDLEKILHDMKKAAEKANVKVVTGDTKVVPKGAADKIFVNTSGIGIIPDQVDVSGQNARPGDIIILSGTIADHGMTVLTQREGMAFDSPLKSDTAPLNHMVSRMLAKSKAVHVLRDPTRGGVGTALNEIAGKSNVGIRIHEDKIPLKNETAGTCELLGFDPLYVANEGKLIAIVDTDCTKEVLGAIQEDDDGKDACIIGEVVSDHPGKVVMQTRIGGSRIIDMLTGSQLPRIC